MEVIFVVTRAPLTFFTYPSPHGSFTIQASNQGLTAVSFGSRTLEGEQRATALTNDAASQLQEYLAGKRMDFTLPIDLRGTSFQMRVWDEIRTIPYGHLLTATAIAERIGKPESYRSIGAAIRQCALTPFIPAHRVESPNATGAQARLYRAFITLEQRTIRNGDQ